MPPIVSRSRQACQYAAAQSVEEIAGLGVEAQDLARGVGIGAIGSRTAWDEALADALEDGEEIDHDTAVIAVAAAEVVAHGLGHATQRDAYTEEVDSFIARAGRPTEDTVALAIAALVAACGPGSELAADWAGTGDPGWDESIEHLRAALSG